MTARWHAALQRQFPTPFVGVVPRLFQSVLDLHCSKLFGLVFRSDRIGNLNAIREVGLEKFKATRA